MKRLTIDDPVIQAMLQTPVFRAADFVGPDLTRKEWGRRLRWLLRHNLVYQQSYAVYRPTDDRHSNHNG